MDRLSGAQRLPRRVLVGIVALAAFATAATIVVVVATQLLKSLAFAMAGPALLGFGGVAAGIVILREWKQLGMLHRTAAIAVMASGAWVLVATARWVAANWHRL